MKQSSSLTSTSLRHRVFGLRQWTGKQLQAMKSSANPLLRFVGIPLYALWCCVGDGLKWLVSPGYRSVRRLSVHGRPGLHQVSNYTAMDRYPVVFNVCRMYYIKQPAVRLLSFGCSTGEEVLTLGQYFPEAQIVGVDINPWNIKTCQKRCFDERMSFYQTDDSAWQTPQTYDAIFCMAVLQRTENRTLNLTDSSLVYPFEQFNEQLVILDGLLKAGGLMVLDETDYRFMDATVAGQYEPLEWDMPIEKQRPIFDCHNQRCDGRQMLYRIFVKSKM